MERTWDRPENPTIRRAGGHQPGEPTDTTPTQPASDDVHPLNDFPH